MRTIKFRAWDFDKKEMSIPFIPLHTRDWVGSSYSLMQFTGLKDKNGKEVYEGDEIIVTDKHGNEDRGYLAYNEKEMAFVIDWGEGRYARMIYDTEDTIEVVGNIYENPELLKG